MKDHKPGWKRIVVGLVVGLGLGFVGLYLVAGKELFELETYQPRNLSILVLTVCVCGFLAEWLLPPERIRLLCLPQGIRVPYISAFLVNVVSVLGGAIIPGGDGQNPTTAAVLGRLGVAAGKSTAILVQIYVLDMIFFAWSAPLSLWYLIYTDTFALPAQLKILTLVAICFVFAGAILLGRYPRLIVRLLLAMAKWPLLRRFDTKLHKIAHDYYRSSRSYMSMPVSSWLKLHLVTAGNWLGELVLLWGLLELYGVETNFLATLALLIIISLASQLVPTPRGAGFVEAAVGVSIGASGGGGGVAAALLVWRLTTVYISFLLGPLAGWLLTTITPPIKRTGPASLQ